MNNKESVIADTGWLFTAIDNHVIKSGNIVNLRYDIKRDLGIPNNNHSVGVIPIGFRPKYNQNAICILTNDGWANTKICAADINIDGSIKIGLGVSTDGYTRTIITGTFISNTAL